MNNLPEELIEMISDYTVGDKKYWKYNYRDCVIDMKMHLLEFDEDTDDITEEGGEFQCNSKDYIYMLHENLNIDTTKIHGEHYWERLWAYQWWRCKQCRKGGAMLWFSMLANTEGREKIRKERIQNGIFCPPE